MQDDIDLRPVAPFYRIRFDDGQTFDHVGGAAEMRAEVSRLSPGDVAGYERFLATSEAIFKVGFEELAHVPFSRWRDMARIVPDMTKLQSYRFVYWCQARARRGSLGQARSVWPARVLAAAVVGRHSRSARGSFPPPRRRRAAR